MQQELIHLKKKLAIAEAKVKALKQQVRIDGLTQLYNKKAFEEDLARYINQANREDKKVVLCYFDLDYFKKINDTYGHPEGDKVLKIVSSTIQSQIRATDRAYRIGGEEFAIVLLSHKGWDPTPALTRIQRSISKETQKAQQGKKLKVATEITLSGGCVEYTKQSETTIKKIREELKRKADEYLYKAKHAGRKQIMIAKN